MRILLFLINIAVCYLVPYARKPFDNPERLNSLPERNMKMYGKGEEEILDPNDIYGSEINTS